MKVDRDKDLEFIVKDWVMFAEKTEVEFKLMRT